MKSIFTSTSLALPVVASSRRPALSVVWGSLLISLALLVLGPLAALAQAQPIDQAEYDTAMAGAVRQAATRVLDSVVTIEIVGATAGTNGEVRRDAPTSGVLVDQQGHVLASELVVRQPAASILVVSSTGKRHTASVVARDHHRHLVLLKIEGGEMLSAIDLPGERSARGEQDLQVGQTTIAVGRFGSEATPIVSTGILSAVGRLDGIALQTDARVSPAFYGGPLLDLRGNVLGILVPAVAEGGAEDATSWYDSGIAFAIPSPVIAKKLDRLTSGEDIKQGLLGIVAKSSDPLEADSTIAAVRLRSPAEAAGLRAGDEITAIAGRLVRRHQQIKQALGPYDAGDSIAVTYQRDGRELSVDITLTDSIPPLQPQRLGVLAADRPTDAANTVGGRAEEGSGTEKEGDDNESAGVVVRGVFPETPASGVLEPGDVIRRVGETEIADVQSLRRLMITAAPDQPLRVVVQRAENETTLSVTPQSIAGAALQTYPQQWSEAEPAPWTVEELKLPEAPNQAALLKPTDAAERTNLGLFVLLLNPGEGEPAAALEDWKEAAAQAGVLVCAIAPENNERWQPKEVDVAERMVAAIAKQTDLERTAVAIGAAGGLSDGDAEAADAMALASAITAARRFFGVAISPQTTPPAIRLRENEPGQSLQILLPIQMQDELPSWSATLKTAGYPIVRGGQVDRASLLRWVRTLQAI